MKKYIVYGRSDCAYCVKVINKLIKKGKCFYVEMYDNQPEKLEQIKKRYNHPTIPVVLIKDEQEILIGGCDDTIDYLQTEKPSEVSQT